MRHEWLRGRLMPHPSCLTPSFFSRRFAAFAEQVIAVPRGIERRIELVNSDEECRRLVEAAGLHAGTGQEVEGVQRLGRGFVLVDDGPESGFGVGEAALLVRAESPAIFVLRAARGR